MASNLYLYISLFWPYFWPLAVGAGGLFGIDTFCQHYWRWGKRQLDRMPAPQRRRVEFGLLFFAVLYAGFAAWSDEHASRLAEHQVTKDAMYWEPLTSDEISSLQAKFSRISPELVVIACETPNCKDLAESFITAFRTAQWQDVKPIFHGGLGITGASGLVINPGDEQTTKIIAAIESSTSLTVRPPSYMRNQVQSEPGIFFVIGAKPF